MTGWIRYHYEVAIPRDLFNSITISSSPCSRDYYELIQELSISDTSGWVVIFSA